MTIVKNAKRDTAVTGKNAKASAKPSASETVRKAIHNFTSATNTRMECARVVMQSEANCKAFAAILNAKKDNDATGARGLAQSCSIAVSQLRARTARGLVDLARASAKAHAVAYAPVSDAALAAQVDNVCAKAIPFRAVKTPDGYVVMSYVDAMSANAGKRGGRKPHGKRAGAVKELNAVALAERQEHVTEIARLTAALADAAATIKRQAVLLATQDAELALLRVPVVAVVTRAKSRKAA